MWTVLPVAQTLWVVVATVFVIMQRRSAQATLAWIFVLAFLPLLGFAVYLFFGPRRFERRRKRRARAHERVKDIALEDADHGEERSPQAVNLMELCANAGGPTAAPRTAHAEIFPDGRAKYDALEKAIAEAKHHIHCEYYIWEPDGIGTRLRDALCARARDGIEVRVLVDGFGSSKAHDRFWAPLREDGGDVRRFNALTLTRWRPRMANFRTHRKIVVIDCEVGFTGGMNVTDVHTSEFSGEDAWRDTHMMLRGPAVKGLQLVFFEDWHYAAGSIPEGPKYMRGTHELPAGDRLLQVVASGPDENLDAIHKLFFSAIAGAHDRVLLTTPYFVPDEAIVSALDTAALRGADVRILVPSGGDVPLVAAAASTYFPELLESGVRVFEYGPPVLHSKTLVVDRDLAVVGTANADNRSFRLNFEVVVASYDADSCDILAKRFDEDLKKAREITRETLTSQPFPRRLFAASARLLSPIL
jgi:cardiolipin synthase